MHENILNYTSREEFRTWLIKYSNIEKECYLNLKRGKPDGIHFSYLDAVEEALCFGWVDSTYTVIEGVRMQKFTPRKKNSNWTELNKERVKRLIKLGLMTDRGLKVYPNDLFIMDKEIENILINEGIIDIFNSFPDLYKRVRISNIVFYRNKDKKTYDSALNNLIKNTKNNKMYGTWDDYGRLSNY